MKLHIVKTDDQEPHERNRGTWDCTLCTAFGTGGLNGWHRHYMHEHYEAAK
jgi:hypothetical protein